MEPCVFGGKLYMTWRETTGGGSGSQVRVAVYNGNDLSPAWAFVDGNGANGINKDVTKRANLPSLFVSGGAMFDTWNEQDPTATNIMVAVYNGDDSAPRWTFVNGLPTAGINFDPAKNASNSRGVVFNGSTYVSWNENNGTNNEVFLGNYSGNNLFPSWQPSIALNFDPAREGFDPQAAVLGASLYLTWPEQNGAAFQIRVLRVF